ncbi:hypothetical protein ACLD9W_09010, partial [Neisseria sp. WLZKY-1]|uniref:hypothetical protein n=1 Tax=Neisseria sp. WLZKY-1 TaxID=3390377 RepID=UPI0039785930
RNRQPMLNIFCLFLSQCEARALTLIGNRFVKEQRRRSSEDVNYTEPGKLQSSRENGKNKANLSCQCAEREFCFCNFPIHSVLYPKSAPAA